MWSIVPVLDSNLGQTTSVVVTEGGQGCLDPGSSLSPGNFHRHRFAFAFAAASSIGGANQGPVSRK